MAESKISLKLLIDTPGQRVLFAEAKKDFVDFLIGMLSLPMGTIINLVTKQKLTVGSFANLYESIADLDDSYLQPNQTKATLLKPVHAISSSSVPQLLRKDASNKKNNIAFHSSPFGLSPSPSRAFLSVGGGQQASAARAGGGEGGFVKGAMTYMVMDDLGVKPMSTISGITLINRFHIKDMSALEEKVVSFGKTEAVKLLNASLHSKSVLTDVFLKDIRSDEKPERTTGIKRARFA